MTASSARQAVHGGPRCLTETELLLHPREDLPGSRELHQADPVWHSYRYKPVTNMSR